MPEATDGLITTNAGTDCSVCVEVENDEGTPGSEPELEVRHLMLEDGLVVQGRIPEHVPPQPGDATIEDRGSSDVMDCTMADGVAQQPTATAAGASTNLEFDYEWKELPPNVAVPAGLEYKMPLDGGPNLARVAPKWQLQLWSEPADAFYRVEVSRFQTIAAVEAALEHTGPSLPQSMQQDWGAVRLGARGVALSRELTVEEARLFQLKQEQHLELISDHTPPTVPGAQPGHQGALWGPSLIGGEALYYVSTPPERPSAGLQCLLDSVETLPCWLPHRAVADALGFSHSAIEAAEARLGGKGYRWASEFENVHSLWPFKEPGFVVHGIRFAGPEQFYQLHKHPDAKFWPGKTTPSFEEAIHRVATGSEMDAYAWGRQCSVRDDWAAEKVALMREAVSHKFRADPELRELLLATAPYPLASVKNDTFWGIGFNGEGENKLAELLMQLRDTLMAEDSTEPEQLRARHADGGGFHRA